MGKREALDPDAVGPGGELNARASEWRYGSRPPSVLGAHNLSVRMGVTIAVR